MWTCEQATRNALYTVELCGANVPVYSGAEKPLLRPTERDLVSRTRRVGRSQLSRTAADPPNQEHAVDAIIETIEANPGLVLVTLGPLTNVALALSRKPAIAAKVSRCVVMGGAPCCEGNVTPAAEYNIWVDPEAARIVMRSGLPVELIGWHLCRGEAVLNGDDIAARRRIRHQTRSLRNGVQQPRSCCIEDSNRRRRNLPARSGCDVPRARSHRRNGMERRITSKWRRRVN